MRSLGLQDEGLDDGLHRPQMGRAQGLGAGAEREPSNVADPPTSSGHAMSARVAFMHSALCQVGLPRSRCAGPVFERRSGLTAIRVEANRVLDGQAFEEWSLPFGATARLLLLHLGTQAVRTKQRRVYMGGSKRGLLKALGMTTSGGEAGGYVTLERQLLALAGCEVTFSLIEGGRQVTHGIGPVLSADGWTAVGGSEDAAIELSEPFFQSLLTHAVPLDPVAIESLRGSALALDLYFWLAHRLCRVRGDAGARVSWRNLREQFGQEYTCPKNFKRAFRQQLFRVLAVYPQARVMGTIGGLTLYPSPPPLDQYR